MGAIKAQRDPLTVMGVPPELFTPALAALVLELSQPPREGMGEAEADLIANKLAEKAEGPRSWLEATRTGYKGPRGHFVPDVPSLPRVAGE